MEYLEKLKDPRWQQKRLKILERDNWACKNCGEKTETLVVHHLVYFSKKNPWEVHDGFLITLCETCHNPREKEPDEDETAIEAINNDIGTLLNTLWGNGWDLADILDLGSTFYNLGVVSEGHKAISIGVKPYGRKKNVVEDNLKVEKG